MKRTLLLLSLACLCAGPAGASPTPEKQEARKALKAEVKEFRLGQRALRREFRESMRKEREALRASLKGMEPAARKTAVEKFRSRHGRDQGRGQDDPHHSFSISRMNLRVFSTSSDSVCSWD